MLNEGDLDFDEFVAGADLPYPYRRVKGRIVSAYPILPGLVNVPVYAVARLAGVDVHARRADLSLVTASLVCAGASLCMYFALLSVFGGARGSALFFSMLFAFATGAFSVAARGMWPHGPSLLFLSGSLALLLRGERATAWSGLLLGLAVANRPTSVLLAVPIAVYVARQRPRRLAGFLLLAAVPAAAVAMYSAAYLDNPLAFGQDYRAGGFTSGVAAGLAGLLVSPSRGLFVFSPIFLLAIAGAVASFRRESDPLPRYLVAGVVLSLLLFARWGMWWGGASFGYRVLIELVPWLTLLTAIGWRHVAAPRPFLRVVFLALAVISMFLHGLGAHLYPSRFNENLDFERARLWSWRESEPALLARKLFGPEAAAPASLPTYWWTPENDDDAIPGWLDTSPGNRAAGADLEVSGWAKSEAGDVDVRILLGDGRVIAPDRSPRPDVALAIPSLGDTSRAGFRATVAPPAGGGAEGLLIVELRAPSGKVRRFGPIRFRWR